MMDLDLIKDIAGYLIPPIVAWFLAKRKYNAEVDDNVIQNLQKSLDFYKVLCDDTNQRLEQVLKANENMEKQIVELKKEVRELNDKLNESSPKNESL